MPRRSLAFLFLGTTLVAAPALLAGCGEPGAESTSTGAGGAGGSGGSAGSGASTANGGATSGTGASAGEGGSGGDGSGGGGPEVVLTEAHCPGGAPSHPAGTVLVFGGGGTEGRVSSSTDGAAWTDVTTMSQGPQFEGHSRNLIRGVGYGGGVFVAVGGLDNAYVVTTCDGEHFRHDVLGTNIEGDLPEPYKDFMSGVAYKDGVFAAAGGGGKKLVSKDHGLTWQAVGGGEGGHLRGVAAGNGLFVATGGMWDGDQAMISTSPDGETWSATATSEGELGRGVVFGNGTFVAIGAKRCARSGDGVAWSDCGIGGRADQLGLHFVKGMFHVQRADGTALSSSDGAAWSTSDGWLPDSMVDTGERYVMARWGARGWSDDSLFDWTSTSFPVEEGLSGLAAGKISFSP